MWRDNNVYCQNQQKIKEEFGDDTWEVKLDVIEDCSKAPKKVDVFISQLAKCKIDVLMEKYKGKEWLAYLIGKDMIIEDIFIPDQVITSSTISNVNCPEYNKLLVIGVIHSHNSMGTNFSGTDNEWINQNHNISICISDNSISGQTRWKTPCGSLKIVNINIKTKVDIDFSAKNYFESIKEKIKEKTYEYTNNWKNQYLIQHNNFKEYFPTDEVEKEIEELNFDEDKSLLEELEEMNESDFMNKESEDL